MEQAVSDKPREFWIDHVGDTVDGEFDAIVCDKEPPHIAIHVIEYAAFEKIKAENERLKAENSKLGGISSGISKDLFDDVCCERDTALAKLAEVEAENRTLNELVEKCREKNMEQLNWNIDKANELRREREAARVMREALEQIQSLAANEHEQGDSKALDDVLDLTCETFKALAKADEIRGGE